MRHVFDPMYDDSRNSFLLASKHQSEARAFNYNTSVVHAPCVVTQEGKVSNLTYTEMAANIFASSIAKGRKPGFVVDGDEVVVTPIKV